MAHALLRPSGVVERAVIGAYQQVPVLRGPSGDVSSVRRGSRLDLLELGWGDLVS